MKIVIIYPQIMKMEMTSQIEVSDSATLDEVKRLVFNSFWETFPKLYLIKTHGTPHDITLKHRNIEIVTDEQLKTLLGKPFSLTSFFSLHPITHVEL